MHLANTYPASVCTCRGNKGSRSLHEAQRGCDDRADAHCDRRSRIPTVYPDRLLHPGDETPRADERDHECQDRRYAEQARDHQPRERPHRNDEEGRAGFRLPAAAEEPSGAGGAEPPTEQRTLAHLASTAQEAGNAPDPQRNDDRGKRGDNDQARAIRQVRLSNAPSQ